MKPNSSLAAEEQCLRPVHYVNQRTLFSACWHLLWSVVWSYISAAHHPMSCSSTLFLFFLFLLWILTSNFHILCSLTVPNLVRRLSCCFFPFIYTLLLRTTIYSTPPATSPLCTTSQNLFLLLSPSPPTCASFFFCIFFVLGPLVFINLLKSSIC